MVKTFKRIAALAMAIALVVCFAVSASAVTVDTTTAYVTGDSTKVNVSVNVSDLGSAAQVTYYATNGGTTVFIDQTDVTGGTATFNFQTDATYLKSAVKVGYTDGTSAEDSDINAKAISYDGTVLETIPTSVIAITVTVPYTAAAGMTVGSVDAGSAATVGTIVYDGANITVPLTNITGDVTLTVTEVAEGQDTSSATMLDAAMVVEDDGARKLTVLGVATGTTDFGVIITTDTIADTYTAEQMTALIEDNKAFKALTANDKGAFAVQVIDEAVDGEDDILIAANGSYNVAIYAKESNSDNYNVVKLATPVAVQ